MDNRASRVLFLTIMACLALYIFGVIAARADAPVPDMQSLSFQPASDDVLVSKYMDIARSAFPGSPCENKASVAWYYMPSTRALGAAVADDACRFAVNFELVTHHMAGLLCTVVVHEYGHLAGFGHSTDRLSPMYPYADQSDFAPCWAGKAAYDRAGATARG